MLILEGDLTKESSSHGLGIWETTIQTFLFEQIIDVVLDKALNVVSLSLGMVLREDGDLLFNDMLGLKKFLIKTCLIVVLALEDLKELWTVQIPVEDQLNHG